MSLGPLDGPSEVGALRARGSQESRWVLSTYPVRSVHFGHADLRESKKGGPNALARTAVGGSPSVPGVGGCCSDSTIISVVFAVQDKFVGFGNIGLPLSPKWGV